jgi:hypothetical protein
VVGTPVIPGSTVWVQVQTDIQNIFQVQLAGTDKTLTQPCLFGLGLMTAAESYTVILPEITSGTVNPVNSLNFALGDLGKNGRSIEAIAAPSPVNPSLFTPMEAYPLVVMGTTNGSRFSNSALQIYEKNQWVACRINWTWSQMTLFTT